MTTDNAETQFPPLTNATVEALARADAPIELPATALGEVAELLREAQAKNIQRQPKDKVGYRAKLIINDKIGWALLAVDVERGDGQ